MPKLHSVQIEIGNCIKEIAVFCHDATNLNEPIDILTTSAFTGRYEPSPNTIFHALANKGINVKELSKTPEIDLRNPSNVWLSKNISATNIQIHRIGCIELLGNRLFRLDSTLTEQSLINSIRSYFHMLDIASLYGVEMSTIALPLLGSGRQRIPYQMILTPLINECISVLKRNSEVKKIYFIEKEPSKAELIANSLKNSFRFINNNKSNNITSKKCAFISYSSADKNIADNLCSKLENNGIKVWYAPRDVIGPYAEAIAKAIDASSYFIVILSKNSIASEHVLNEIDLAFQNLPHNIKFKPLRIDDTDFTPSFKYYLSRQHWMDATHPPLEERLNEFVKSLNNL